MSCPLHRCPNMAVKEAEDDENIDEDDVLPLLKDSKKTSQTKNKKQTKNKLSWVGEPIKVCTLFLFQWKPGCSCLGLTLDFFLFVQTEGRKQYYMKVRVENEVVEVGDCVSVSPADPSHPLYLARCA